MNPGTPETSRQPRKIVLIKRALQLRYIGLVFLSVLVASALVGGDVYYSLAKVTLAECPSVSDSILKFHGVLLFKGALYLGLMLFVWLYVSHRFAGPIYRFERSAREVGGGNLTHRVSLRTGDELQDFQEEFNGMIAGLQSLVQKDRNLAARLRDKLDEAMRRLPEGAEAARQELNDIRIELEHLTRSFKA